MITIHALLLLTLAAANQPSPLMRAKTGALVVEFLEDPDSRALCGGIGVLRLDLRAAALVTLTVDGRAVHAAIDGAPAVQVQAQRLPAGSHELSVSLDPWAGAPATNAAYRIEARDPVAATTVEAHSGQVIADLVNAAVLRVGHTFVSGVDLLDGHLVRRVTDMQIPGRHLGLEVTRAYASAARGMRGLAGVGWTPSFVRSLAARPACGLYAVGTLDGTTLTFLSDDGRRFKAQRGCHSRLTRGRDGSFDFEDKAAIRYHFSAKADAWGSHPLEFLEEPHGDRTVLRYDSRGRVLEVAEVQREGRGVSAIPRLLRVGHKESQGFARIAWIDAPGLGLRVEYEYDIHGNLTGVVRRDEERELPEREAYTYSTHEDRDRHQLLTARLADGQRDVYRYVTATGAPPGTEVAVRSRLLPFGKVRCVASVVSTPAAGKGSTETTSFTYDHSRAAAGRFGATVGTGPSATRYSLNSDGNPLEIDEPLGRGRKVWRSTWDPSSVTKSSERDDKGFHAQYTYDARGNLSSSTEVKRLKAVPQEARYAYDPRFSKLVYRKDAQGRISTWDIDPRTGDLIMANEAGSGGVRYRYDPQGRLIEQLDAQGRRTVYSDHDTFGFARRTVTPDGKVSLAEYDLRGRRIKND